MRLAIGAVSFRCNISVRHNRIRLNSGTNPGADSAATWRGQAHLCRLPAMPDRAPNLRVLLNIRAIVGTVALLAVIAPSGAALVHGAVHHQEVLEGGVARGGVLSFGADVHEGSNAQRHVPDAGQTVRSDATGTHLVLHARTVASSKGRFSPVLPAEARQPSVAPKVRRTAVAIGVVLDYPAPSHSFVPDRPRAPPLA